MFSTMCPLGTLLHTITYVCLCLCVCVCVHVHLCCILSRRPFETDTHTSYRVATISRLLKLGQNH